MERPWGGRVWHYDGEAPALDGVEENDTDGDGIVDDLYSRTYDDLELTEELHTTAAGSTLTSQAWSNGRLANRRTIEADWEGVDDLRITRTYEDEQVVQEVATGSWASTVSTEWDGDRKTRQVEVTESWWQSDEWTWADVGLLEAYRDVDSEGDGMIDSSTVESWEWRCP